ncbi:hypothetical protein [Enterobacter vonholyi]|uniref:hypothetical protein n=1 Tax=Enterobacter vonholyi TaxID=2797505 RepID=UPI0020763848|nr:hypothetical protein [Enterobacter vonholyi]MCM7619799.1 hypothetical protein [Enterobacter vonholyi]
MTIRITANQAELPHNNETNKITIREGSLAGASLAGTIARQIGTGEHARDSFIWMTLKYCFRLGGAFSVFILLAYMYYVVIKNEPEKIDIISFLKDVWSIFTPILTLALGYAFGKRERDKEN